MSQRKGESLRFILFGELVRAYLKGRWRVGVGGLFLFLGAENWPRRQEERGLKRLSVAGFSGFILCQGRIKEKI